MIIGLLEEVRKKSGFKYVIQWRDGQIQITDCGINTPVYKLDVTNTFSTNSTLSLNKLVTRAKVIGRADVSENRQVEAISEGNLDFGVLQEIVFNNDRKLAEAIAEADTIISERGKPSETAQITAPDLPFLRKGDKIEVSAGNLIGFFY